jgi:hypothetical protein
LLAVLLVLPLDLLVGLGGEVLGEVQPLLAPRLLFGRPHRVVGPGGPRRFGAVAHLGHRQLEDAVGGLAAGLLVGRAELAAERGEGLVGRLAAGVAAGGGEEPAVGRSGGAGAEFVLGQAELAGGRIPGQPAGTQIRGAGQ